MWSSAADDKGDRKIKLRCITKERFWNLDGFEKRGCHFGWSKADETRELWSTCSGQRTGNVRPLGGWRAILLALTLGLSLSAFSCAGLQARLVVADLDDVGINLPPNARIPLQSTWKNEEGVEVQLAQALAGRPALLVFADYTCRTLCGPIVTFAVDALGNSGLTDRDYRLVMLGIDPRDGATEASTMKRERIVDQTVASAAALLSADQATIGHVADAVGYRFQYDAERDQYAHPAVALVLTPDGRITRVLSALGMTAADVRLALVEAGEGLVGTFSDKARLLCYGFDPSIGAYTPAIYRALAFAAALTMASLAIGIAWLSVRSGRAS
jgi:protein SCO1/2